MPSSIRFVASLSQGVLLEKQNVLLPWGATRQKLNELDVPYEERESADRWELHWPKSAVLNGLEIPLNAVFFKAATYRDTVLRRVACDHLNDGAYDSAKSKYEELKNYISQLCGKPEEEKDESSKWVVPGAAINLYIWERFDWFCSLAFTKEP